MRKIILLVALSFVLPLMMSAPAAAQIYPWCAIYGGAFGGAENCGFTSRQQCEATIRGAGGTCQPNPHWLPPSERPRRERRQRNDN